MLFKKVMFPRVPAFCRQNLTPAKVYELAGLNEWGTPCVIDDNGEPWPLDDGYGVRDPHYEVVPD